MFRPMTACPPHGPNTDVLPSRGRVPLAHALHAHGCEDRRAVSLGFICCRTRANEAFDTSSPCITTVPCVGE
eukprot:scaffold104937_cov75-Phaeocystis_antarctica.AAC.9